MAIGITLFVIALLLLVPYSWWRWLGRLFSNTPRNIRTAYWLQDVLRFNKERVYESVKSHFLTGTSVNAWGFQGLTNNPLDPYFQIELELVNTSIFDICVSGIEGKIIVEGSRCQKDARVDKQYGKKQGHTFWVTIYQPVSESMVKRITEAKQKGEKLRFDLSNMFLTLETTTKGYKGMKIIIKFTIYDIIPS